MMMMRKAMSAKASRARVRRGVTVNNMAAGATVTTDAKALRTGPRVTPTKLPRIFVYDHCPFCVRVRLALGMKNIKHEVVFLANDDFDTPKALCGKKIAPILELPLDGAAEPMRMTESLDIIDLFESNDAYGPTNVIKPATGRSDIKAWQKKTKDLLRLLHRPRYMKVALPEFQQEDSRDYFVSSHPVPPFEKPEWKADDFGMERRWSAFDEAYAKTDELLPELNAALVELEDLIYCEEYCSEGGFSYDDIDLWARLRSVTLVKGAQFGTKTTKYLENLSIAGDIPLYFTMAC